MSDKLQVWIISRSVELEPRLCFNFRMIEFGAKHYGDCAFIQAVLPRDVLLTQPPKDKPANHSIQILFLQKKENSQRQLGVCARSSENLKRRNLQNTLGVILS